MLTHNKLCILLLLWIFTAHPMLPRARIPATPRTHSTHSSQTHTSLPSARKAQIRIYSQSPDKMLKILEQKIKQCQISEREYYEELLVWENITSQCLMKGTCLAGGKCVPKANCLVKGQRAYMAWKHAEKNLVAHEIARNVLIFEKKQ